jgi:type I restriction enzyme M protein
VRKAIVVAIGERDEAAEICRSADGSPEPHPELRDYESVPLGESVEEFFGREVEKEILAMLGQVAAPADALKDNGATS